MSFNFMAAITTCSDFQAPQNTVWQFPLFPHLFPMKWWDQKPWSSFSECWGLSQLFHSPLSLSSRGSLVLWCITYNCGCLVGKLCPTLATPWTVVFQAPLSMGFSRQEYWSGLPFPSPGDLLDPGTEPGSPALQADALPSEPPGKQKVKRN